MEAQIYKDCVRYYPFVLGAQPVRRSISRPFTPRSPTKACGLRRTHRQRRERTGSSSIATIEIGGRDRLGRPRGVLSAQDHAAGRAGARHGAVDRRPLAVRRRQDRDHRQRERCLVRRLHQRRNGGGVGGYDNADGKRRTLGGGATGGHTAVPIFEPIMQAVWAHVATRTALAPPSPEAKRQLSCRSIDLEWAKRSATAAASAGRSRRSPPLAVHRMLPPRSDRQGARHPIPVGVARRRLYYRDPRYDVAPNPFPFFAPFQSRQPGYNDPRRNNGYYQDGQGRYIQAPRDSGQPQYGRDPRAQPPPGRDVYGREVRPQQQQQPQQPQWDPSRIWGQRPF